MYHGVVEVIDLFSCKNVLEGFEGHFGVKAGRVYHSLR